MPQPLHRKPRSLVSHLAPVAVETRSCPVLPGSGRAGSGALPGWFSRLLSCPPRWESPPRGSACTAPASRWKTGLQCTPLHNCMPSSRCRTSGVGYTVGDKTCQHQAGEPPSSPLLHLHHLTFDTRLFGKSLSKH